MPPEKNASAKLISPRPHDLSGRFTAPRIVLRHGNQPFGFAGCIHATSRRDTCQASFIHGATSGTPAGIPASTIPIEITAALTRVRQMPIFAKSLNVKYPAVYGKTKLGLCVTKMK